MELLNIKNNCIEFLKIHDDAGMKKGTNLSCGYDVKCLVNTYIAPHNRVLLNTGLRLKENISDNIYIQIASRSSMAMKGIDVGAGVIDADYTKEIKVLLCNNSKEGYTINKGDYMAQLIPIIIARNPVLLNNNIVNSLEERVGGFGSTN